MPQASGFSCPRCKSDRLQEVVSKDLVHILVLKCSECDEQWAVESAYPRGFNDKHGMVK